MSVVLGNVIVRSTDCVNCSVVVVLSVAPVMPTARALGLVFEFANLQLAVNKVLLVSTSVVFVPTRVVVAAGIVTVFPPLLIVEITGVVSVLLVSTSVVFVPTKVVVGVGIVRVPMCKIGEMTDAVSV